MTGGDIFSNELLQQQMSDHGYVVVPFADVSAINELKAFYESLRTPPASGTHVTMFNPSYEYRKSVDNKIKEVCAAQAEKLMGGYKVLYTNFMVKEPGSEGDFPVHQDWTYVDEEKYSSYAFWIPLSDVDESNGALHIVKGSHRFHNALRGPYVHEPFTSLSEVIKDKYSEVIRLRAGEALVWDHRLIHFSKPNITPSTRLAFTLIMVPENAEVIHCYGRPESGGTIIDKLKADTEFYMKYKIGSSPDFALLLETIVQPAVSFDEIGLNELKKTTVYE